MNQGDLAVRCGQSAIVPDCAIGSVDLLDLQATVVVLLQANRQIGAASPAYDRRLQRTSVDGLSCGSQEGCHSRSSK